MNHKIMILSAMIVAVVMNTAVANVDNATLQKIEAKTMQLKARSALTEEEIAGVHQKFAAYKPRVDALNKQQLRDALENLRKAQSQAEAAAVFASILKDKELSLAGIEVLRLVLDCHEDCLKSESSGFSCIEQANMFMSLVAAGSSPIKPADEAPAQ